MLVRLLQRDRHFAVDIESKRNVIARRPCQIVNASALLFGMRYQYCNTTSPETWMDWGSEAVKCGSRVQLHTEFCALE